MKIYCPRLGILIDLCNASRSDAICRKCEGQEEKPAEPDKREVKKRCACGRAFSPKSNRQRFCARCGKRNEGLKNRDRQARFKKGRGKSLRLPV